MTTEQIIKTIPKVLLHDHLDGGLRPQTIIDLAEELRYDKLPTKIILSIRNAITSNFECFIFSPIISKKLIPLFIEL